MIAPDQMMALVSAHGLPVIGLVAVVEGPVVTVLAGWAVATGALPLGPLVLVLIVADLVGDLGFYALGRRGLGWLPQRLRRRLGLNPDRLDRLTDHFCHRGGRILVLGKLTHSAGALVLTAAGAARMPVAPFLFFNLVATVPKSLALLALGVWAGHAWERIDTWIANGSWIALALGLAALLAWRLRPAPASAALSPPGTRRPE